MAKPERYWLADLAHQLPMPDRGGRLFDQTEEGEAVDPEDPFWSVLIADKDIVPVSPTAGRKADRPSRPLARAAAGPASLPELGEGASGTASEANENLKKEK